MRKVYHVHTLYAIPGGWTEPLRQCRGIVFSHSGRLVAKSYAKFFNYGEHPETSDIPEDMPFHATEKKDGHLGIIFPYLSTLHLTTRGSFESMSADLGNTLLRRYVRRRAWRAHALSTRLTLLTEIIHPATHVQVDYGKDEHLVLLDAISLDTLEPIPYADLLELGGNLGLPVSGTWSGSGLAAMLDEVEDLRVENREGWVARFADGRMAKFKYRSYLNGMIGGKLSYLYVLRRMQAGDFRDKMRTLPQERYDAAHMMRDDLCRTLRMSDPGQALDWLAQRVPRGQWTSQFRSAFRRAWNTHRVHGAATTAA